MGKEAIGAINEEVYKWTASGPTKLLNTVILLVLLWEISEHVI